MLGIYLTLFNFRFFPSNIFANSLGFDAQIITLSLTNGRFTSFPNCMTSVSFSCLIALAGTLSAILSTSGESQKSSLVPEI